MRSRSLPPCSAPPLSSSQQSTSQHVYTCIRKCMVKPYAYITQSLVSLVPKSRASTLAEASHTTMQAFSLLLRLIVLLLPLAAANGGDLQLQDVVCVGHGNRTAINYTNYGANIQQLAAIFTSSSSLPSGHYVYHDVGKFPEGVHAVSRCRNGTGVSSCRACITTALQDAHRVCPYHKEIVFFNGNCSLELYDGLPDINIDNYGIDVLTAPEEGNIDWLDRKRGSLNQLPLH
ncbi:hypothetical protein ACP4OV_025626 [Aristida adscensionis]